MNDVVLLEASILLTRVAEEESVSRLLINRLMRSIVRHGLAQPVATWLLQEEQRQSNERVRKEEETARFRRKTR